MSSDAITTRPVAEGFSVTGQIGPQQMAAIAAAGFRTILCNRPDAEEAGQPAFALIEAAARRAGLEAAYLPIGPKGIGPEQTQIFATLLATLPHPVLAYCRSGARSTALWQASRNG